MHSGPARSPRASRTIYTPSNHTYPLTREDNFPRLFAKHSLRASSSALTTNNQRRPSYHERIFEPCAPPRTSPVPYSTRTVASPSARSRTIINNENVSPTYSHDQDTHPSMPSTAQSSLNNQIYHPDPIRPIRVEGEIIEWPTGMSFIFPTISASPTLSPLAFGFEGASELRGHAGWDARTGRDQEFDARDDEMLHLWGSARDTGSNGMEDGPETTAPDLDSPYSSARTDTSRQSGTPIDTLSQPYRPKPYDLPYPIKDRQELQRARIRAYLENKELVKRSIRGSGDVLIGGGDIREALVIRQERQDLEIDIDHHQMSTPTGVEGLTSSQADAPARVLNPTPRYISIHAEILPHVCTTKCLCCFRPSSATYPQTNAQINQDNTIQDPDQSVWVEDDSMMTVEVIDSNEGSEGIVASVGSSSVDVIPDETAGKADELYAGLLKRNDEERSRQAASSRLGGDALGMDSVDDTSIPFEARRSKAEMTDQAGLTAVIDTKEKEMDGLRAIVLMLGDHKKRTIEFVSEEGIESPQPVILPRARARARARSPQTSSSSSLAGPRIKPSPLKAQVDYPSPTPSPTNIVCRPLPSALTPPSSPRKFSSSFGLDTAPFVSTEYIAQPLEPVYQDQVKTATILNRLDAELAMTNIWNRPAPPLDEAEWEIMVQCMRERKIRAEMEKRRRKEAENLRQFTSARARMAKPLAENLDMGLGNATNTSPLKRTASEETRLFVQDISEKRYLSRRWPSTITTFSGRDRQVPIDSRTFQNEQRPKADASVRQKRRPQPLTLLPAPPQPRLDIFEPTLLVKAGDTTFFSTQEASDTESELTPLPEDE
jgi:hypothetical protein